jgi:CRISPR-associated protein Cmr6
MRKALDLGTYPTHRGLAYDVVAPVGSDGKLDLKREDAWLNEICRPGIPEGYKRAFKRWRASFHRGRDVAFEVHCASRLLIGHGNPAPTEVGITLHHTWGVPVLPGSALKGLTAHFVATCYGADPDENAPERAAWTGPVHENGRLIAQPGAVYRRLFGAPGVSGADGSLLPGCQGEVVFHDALWIPQDSEPWLARDVLTVHQKTYYQGRDQLPSDHDDPNPVAFVSVLPKTAFLVALSCPDSELRQMAARFVKKALCEWGIGGKTAAGYGRMSLGGNKALAPAPTVERSPVIRELTDWLDSHKQLSQGEQLERIEREWLARLMPLTPPEHELVEKLLRKRIRSPKKQTQLQTVIRTMRNGS